MTKTPLVSCFLWMALSCLGQAALTITVTDLGTGNGARIEYSGSLNLQDAGLTAGGGLPEEFNNNRFTSWPGSIGLVDIYALNDNPISIADLDVTGTLTQAVDTAAGDGFSIRFSGPTSLIYVANGYVPGSTLTGAWVSDEDFSTITFGSTWNSPSASIRTLTFDVVPEPSKLLLFALATLFAVSRRKRPLRSC